MTYTEINDFLKPYARQLIDFLSGNPIKSLIFFLILLKIATSIDRVSDTIYLSSSRKNEKKEESESEFFDD